MTLEAARSQMVNQQVRTWDVLDQRVLDALTVVPREAFAPDAYRDVALADVDIPIGQGQYMAAPKLVGRMIQSLNLEPGHRVLEIGTGSGYATACLAKLAGHVTSLDVQPEFSAKAAERLNALSIDNVDLITIDAFDFEPDVQFDAILVNGSLPEFAGQFQDWLRPDGCLVVVVGEGVVMEAVRVTRLSEQEWARESLFETVLPALIHAPQSEAFVF